MVNHVVSQLLAIDQNNLRVNMADKVVLALKSAGKFLYFRSSDNLLPSLRLNVNNVEAKTSRRRGSIID